ncbi:MAG: HAMP domain-containing histidine kinase [Nitrospirae bacterium]|nr:HAMP domain-containing histidine kinase [Candidatus Manganitrophaceae bacterium]
MKRILNSVFTKLLLILLVAGVCINLSVTGFMQQMVKKNEPARQKNIIHHLMYIVQEIGNPPDFDRAKRVSQQLTFNIRYESPAQSWSTSESLSPPPPLKLQTSNEYPNFQMGEDRGHRFFILNQGEGRFIFELGRGFEWDVLDVGAVVRLVTLLSLILAGAYLLIRSVLSPVRALKEGVREVSKGNLDYRLSLKRSDELGELAKAFNAMTDRIRTMLRAKEQLMLDVSHELRSPLTRMKVALESLPDGHTQRSIKEDVAEMEEMVSEVLKTARSHYMHAQLNLQQIDIVELLSGVLGTFKGQHPGVEAIKLPDRIELTVDPDRVKSVLKNILDNAIKYSFDSNVPVKVFMEDRGPYLIIRVQDRGMGIPEDELPFIFEPFYRVDKSRSKDTGGYGLGLSLCKTIMEGHHGKIEVESVPDAGTIVSLFFPHSKNGGPGNGGS